MLVVNSTFWRVSQNRKKPPCVLKSLFTFPLNASATAVVLVPREYTQKWYGFTIFIHSLLKWLMNCGKSSRSSVKASLHRFRNVTSMCSSGNSGMHWNLRNKSLYIWLFLTFSNKCEIDANFLRRACVKWNQHPNICRSEWIDLRTFIRPFRIAFLKSRIMPFPLKGINFSCIYLNAFSYASVVLCDMRTNASGNDWKENVWIMNNLFK